MKKGLLFLLLLAGLTPAAGMEQITSETVREWLGRVSHAGETLNYQGTFVYRQGNQLEAVHIIHKADSKGEHERMVSLNGVAREVIRNNDNVTCILPDNRSVLVDNHGPENRLPSIPSDLSHIGEYYDFIFEGYERVASRPARKVMIRPKDSFRYGYRLWIDDAFELLLKSELLDSRGNAIEQIMFTDLRLYEQIDDDLLKPNISGKEYTWVTDSDDKADEPMPMDDRWRADKLPQGFMLSHRNKHHLPDTRMPVEHIVYTDGLAWVSVYIDKLEAQKESLQGASSMGAVNAYGRSMGDYHITAVGEVPYTTVQLIADAVNHY
ncbi:MucB/RseB C-terminal domain-containing protein [Sulfuriflexus sp.]|uniref:MucB/RseB C-terminal domain-containing protein n=1 Tax=Sulfuriflexus sp. TaxID=2015443 RepID=UPI0028CDA6C2|nr:MucB/RseB C-terminal domain-containing protein [Sulfuriflexus sp.]MDT8405382.1 MucB/RseB C-terminal domain-containing protein [Sulfuriflexus sp.]